MASVRARRSARLAASSPSRLARLASRPLPNSAARSAAPRRRTTGGLAACRSRRRAAIRSPHGRAGELAGERRAGAAPRPRRAARAPSASRAGGRGRGRRRRGGRRRGARRRRRPAAPRPSGAAATPAAAGRSGRRWQRRAHRLEQRLGLGGDQDQVGVGGRLLERLQQRVLALLGHRVGGLDHEDAALALERPVGDRADHPLADVLDQVLVAGRAQPDEVGMRRGIDQRAAAGVGRIVGARRRAARRRTPARPRPCPLPGGPTNR